MLLEVLPVLDPGVLVHVHEMFLPYEYPRGFLEKQLYWQEQYLLQALLVENPNLEVLFPADAVARERPDLSRRSCRAMKPQLGQGLRIRRTKRVRPKRIGDRLAAERSMQGVWHPCGPIRTIS